MQGHPPAWISYILPLVIVVVLALRLRGLRRVRRLRLETLWIVPAVYLAAFAVATWEYPPRGALGWLYLVLAAGAGSAFGWRRGAMMRITIDPGTHRLNQQSSPAALLFIVLLIVMRQGLHYEGAALGLNMLQVTGILMAFGVGLLGAMRLEMFARARRLLADTRAQETIAP